MNLSKVFVFISVLGLIISLGAWGVIFWQQKQLQATQQQLADSQQHIHNLQSQPSFVIPTSVENDGEVVATQSDTEENGSATSFYFLSQQIDQLDQNQVTMAADLVSLDSAIDGVEEELESLQGEVNSLKNSNTTSTVTTTTTSSTAVKTQYVYLGSGTSTDTDWSDVDSAQAVVDLSSYGSVKSVVFEAALSIVGGEVHARIINKTTGQIYTESEITHNTSTSTWKTSRSLPLPSTSQRYVVQLRSSSGEEAVLNSARLKIEIE